MHGGEISGNTGSTTGGGVNNSGTFTMNDGKISGNTATIGGGVYVAINGTFTMKGGEISGNTGRTTGGGVSVANGSTARFYIVTGTIYGSEDTVQTDLRNTAVTGAALAKGASGVAQRGTLTGTNGGFVRTADLVTTETTIKVKDGALQ
jgi:hypothetical protein